MMLSNQSYFRDSVAILGKAWHWWVGELAETLKLLARIGNSNIIDFEVLQSHGLALSNSNGITNIRGRQNIALKFNDNAILYRKLRLPTAARKDIDKVVGYEFDKYFPMDADNALVSCDVIEPGSGAEAIEVETRDFGPSLSSGIGADSGSYLIPASFNNRDDQRIRVWRSNATPLTTGLAGSAIEARIRNAVEPIVVQ